MASSSNSDYTESTIRRAANDNKSGGDQERNERRPSSSPNSAESAIAPRPSLNPISPASGTGVGLISGGTGISFNASGPFNIFTQNTRLQGASSLPLFTCSDAVTTLHGIRPVMEKRSHDALGESSFPPSARGATTHKRPCGMTYNPFGRLICCYPNPEFPIFDAMRLTVDLPMDPPQPYSPLVSNKDGSDDNLQPLNGQTGEVVEDNAKELAAQGEEAAAETRPTIRDDVVSVARRYRVPDINVPAREEDEEEEEN